MRSALSWNFTQPRMVLSYRRFGTIFKGEAVASFVLRYVSR